MKKRLWSLILAVVLCSSILTGCMGAVSQLTILQDGSGSYTVSAGYTQEGLELMAAMNGEEGLVSTEGLTPFTYNGYTYYGQVETSNFSNIEALNVLLNTEEDTEGATESSTTFEVVRNADDSISLTVTLVPSAEEETTEGETMEEEPDAETQAMMDELMAQMTVVYEFTFPSNVTQTQGSSEGITINGNLLILDIRAISENLVSEATYTFTTASGAAGVLALYFTDVTNASWYYDAVMALAEGGLVTGIGNNLFDPEGALTYAQFCQILARAKGLPTGTANDYWAYTAIESCLDAGYILDRGPVVSENFDVAIPREAAVSAMYLAKRSELQATATIDAAMIPDYETISDAYRDNILAAYNSGITSGVDDLRTFKPQDTLTRAQVCQLFYNLSWTQAK